MKEYISIFIFLYFEIIVALSFFVLLMNFGAKRDNTNLRAQLQLRKQKRKSDKLRSFSNILAIIAVLIIFWGIAMVITSVLISDVVNVLICFDADEFKNFRVMLSS